MLPAAWNRPIVPDWRGEYHFSADRLAEAEASKTNVVGSLAYAALHTVQQYGLRDRWGYDRRVEAELESRFGRDGGRLYKDVVSQFPGVNIVMHRALEVEIEAHMTINTGNGPETVFNMRDNGRQALNAADLQARWLRRSDETGAILEPNLDSQATHRLAYNVATKFGGQIIASSGEHGLEVSLDGEGAIQAHDITVSPPVEGNLVVVRLPHTQPTEQTYTRLYAVPDLGQSAV